MYYYRKQAETASGFYALGGYFCYNLSIHKE